MNLEHLTRHQPAEETVDGVKRVVCRTCRTPFPCRVNTSKTQRVLQQILLTGATS
jgi:hypothetical protein